MKPKYCRHVVAAPLVAEEDDESSESSESDAGEQAANISAAAAKLPSKISGIRLIINTLLYYPSVDIL